MESELGRTSTSAVRGRSEHFSGPGLDGVSLHALRFDAAEGKGDESAPPLVLLHGGGANAHWWDHLAPELSRKYRAVALDFRGHGDSDYPEERVSGAFQRDLEGLLAHLGDPRAVLVGHSMGGHIAIDHAAHRGARAVIAIEITRGGGRKESRRTRLALLLRRSYATREEAVRRYRFLPAAHGASEELRRAIAEHSIREEADGRFGFKFDARWFLLPPRDPPPLERIMCPVLIVRGGDSRLLTAEGARRVAGQIRGARLVEIPNAGHNVHLERPAEVLRTIDEFLAGI